LLFYQLFVVQTGHRKYHQFLRCKLIKQTCQLRGGEIFQNSIFGIHNLQTFERNTVISELVLMLFYLFHNRPKLHHRK